MSTEPRALRNLVATVRRTIQERGLFKGGERTLLAVSGGPDSLAMLHVFARLAPQYDFDLHIAHFDHRLRDGSGADAAFVARQAASLGLPATVRAAEETAPIPGRSPEETARDRRQSFLQEVAEGIGAVRIATAHTMDDQAETILMRLVRGAGPTALAAMAPTGPGPFVKPLLGLEREALRAWLRKRHFPFRDDPSNRSLAFDRNRVRRLVVPVLAKALNPAAARHLVEAAARLREDAAFLDALARERFDALASRRAGALVLQAPSLAALPRPLASRVARIALEAAGCDPRRVSSRHVEALVGLAGSSSGASLDLPGGLVSRRRGRLLEFRPCDSPGRS